MISIEKKRLVYMHIVVVIMVVFCALPGPQEKDDSARRIWISGSWILFSHMWGMSANAHYIHRNN